MAQNTPKTILCVDDDPHMLSSLRRLLNSPKYTLLLAQGPDAALQRVQELTPDLVILDFMMPGMNGIEVLRRMREQGLTDVPVVMLTARGSSRDMMHGYQEGVVYYITKPFRNEHVLNVVEYLVGDLNETEREELALRL